MCQKNYWNGEMDYYLFVSLFPFFCFVHISTGFLQRRYIRRKSHSLRKKNHNALQYHTITIQALRSMTRPRIWRSFTTPREQTRITYPLLIYRKYHKSKGPHSWTVSLFSSSIATNPSCNTFDHRAFWQHHQLRIQLVLLLQPIRPILSNIVSLEAEKAEFTSMSRITYTVMEATVSEQEYAYEDDISAVEEGSAPATI